MTSYLKTIAVTLLIAGAGCSSTTENKPPSLHGNWVFVNSAGTAGTGATFNPDGTYVLLNMVLTSSASANAEVETGVYTVNGAAITFTPQQWTCPGPDPVVTLNHSFSSTGNLVFSSPSGVISLERNTASATESFVIAYGCFDRKTKEFKRAELAEVANE